MALVGCQTGLIDDINVPGPDGSLAVRAAWGDVRSFGDGLYKRVVRGEITREKYDALLLRRANEMIAAAEKGGISPDEAWMAADLFRIARRWEEAERLYRIAVENAVNEDRRVNDSIRLALAQANLGRVPEAIASARAVFDAPPKEKAPILTGILLEVVPAAEGKGHDADLAKLLEEAIGQALETQVDPDSVAGGAFISARPVHVRNAVATIERLYRSAGRPEQIGPARARIVEQIRRAELLSGADRSA